MTALHEQPSAAQAFARTLRALTKPVEPPTSSGHTYTLISSTTPTNSTPPASASSSSSFDESRAIVTLVDQSLLVPRGRFDVHITPANLVFASAKQTLSVPLTAVQRIASLPDANKRDHLFVIGIAPEHIITIGKTKYAHVITQGRRKAETQG